MKYIWRWLLQWVTSYKQKIEAMKTALTQLIEKWETERGSYIPNAPIYAAFIAEAKEFLEAEKEQITEAYRSGKHDSGIDKCFNSAEYYTQTFKSDE